MKDHTLDRLASTFDGQTTNSGYSVDPETGGFLCGDVDIRINHDAQWFYHGSPIGRKELVRLFSTVLQRDESGDYWLITPAEKARIQVEDVPFAAVELTVDGQDEAQTLTFRTNVDEIVIAGPAHPLRIETDSETGEPSPYLRVRDELDARLTRSVYYQMVDLGVERMVDGATIYGVWSGGEFFKIGEVDAAC